MPRSLEPILAFAYDEPDPLPYTIAGMDAMLLKIRELLRRTHPFRARFGTLAGTRLAMQLRDWHRPRGERYAVRVSGFGHDVWLRAGTSDARVLCQIFVDEELAFPVAGRPRVIVDAGANIGLSSVYLARRHPTATVIALEIDAANFELLCRNVAAYPSVVPRRVGLWSRSAALEIENPGAECWSFRAAEAAPGAANVVEAVGVADLVAEFGPIDHLEDGHRGG